MDNDKCPKCGGELSCLGGCSAHPDNWYCTDKEGCGWQAWNEDTHSDSSRSPAGSPVPFEREDRYLVIKRKDIEKSLTPTERNILMELAGKIYLDRMEEGRGGLRCVVVEHNWPEYEPTWAAIKARTEGQ